MQVVLISRELKYFRNGGALRPVHAKLLSQFLQVQRGCLAYCIHCSKTDIETDVRTRHWFTATAFTMV